MSIKNRMANEYFRDFIEELAKAEKGDVVALPLASRHAFLAGFAARGKLDFEIMDLKLTCECWQVSETKKVTCETCEATALVSALDAP